MKQGYLFGYLLELREVAPEFPFLLLIFSQPGTMMATPTAVQTGLSLLLLSPVLLLLIPLLH